MECERVVGWRAGTHRYS
jgi:hypothetical protein